MGGVVSRLLIAWSVLLLAASPCVLADDSATYEFREKYREGQQFNVLFSQSMQLKARLYASGTLVSTLESVEAAQDKGQMTVLKIADGAPVAEQIVLDPSCGEFSQRSGQAPKQVYSRYAGKTVTVRRDGSGGVAVDVEGDNDPRLASQLRGWLERDSNLYPDHPVRLKEKWDLSKKLAQVLNARHGEQVSGFCRLQSVKSIKGREFAELRISAAMMGTVFGTMQVQTQAEGSAWVDLATGRVAKMDLAGDVSVSGLGGVRLRDGRYIRTSAVGDGKFEYHELCVAAKSQKDAIASDDGQ